MKGRSIIYTAEELAWIEARKEMPRRELCEMFCARFNRTVSLQNLKALCTRKGWKTGRTGCFHSGHKPHNKGKPFSPAGSEKGRFKKGRLPHNTRHLGHERLSKEGYVEVSVSEPNPRTGFERSYVLKHRYLWEKANGPVPKGHVLKSIDGDKANTSPANWEAIPRALLPRLSGGRWFKPYDAYEPELRPMVLTTARLDHAAREARKGAE